VFLQGNYQRRAILGWGVMVDVDERVIESGSKNSGKADQR